MAHRTRLVWDEGFTAYDFGPSHPMGPVRLALTTRLAEALGVLDGVEVVGGLPPPIDIVTTFSAAVCRTATQPEAAARLLRFMASPEVDDVKRQQGMQPA